MSNTKEYKVRVYSRGLAYASVCTDMPPRELELYMGEHDPTGVDSAWHVAHEDFQDGTPNGSDCPDTKGNRHWLLVC